MLEKSPTTPGSGPDTATGYHPDSSGQGKTDPLTPEKDSADHFLIALQAVARHFDRPASATVLTAGLPLIGGRLTAELTIRAAERVGLTGTASELKLDDLVPLQLPAILLTRDGTSLAALSRQADGQLIVADARGTRALPLMDVTRIYAGKAILLEAVYQARDLASHDGSATISGKAHWFWGTVRRFWKSYLRVGLAAAMINLFALASPLFVMNVYDRVLPNKAIATLWVLALGVAFVVAFDFTLKTARAFLIDKVGRRIDIRLSSALFDKVLNAGLMVRPASTGAFTSRVSQYEFIREFFTSNTLAVFIDMLFIFLFVAVISQIAGWLAIIPLVATFVVLAAGIVIQHLIGKSLAAAQNEAAERQGLLVEAVGAIETVKSLRAEGTLLRKWDNVSRASSRTSEKIKRLSAIGLNIAQFVQQLVTVAIIVGGAYLFAEGEMSTGAIIATVMLASRTVAPLSQIAMLLTRARHAFLSIKILDTVMNLPDDRPSAQGFVNRSIEHGEIVFRSVTFRYPEVDRKVLDGLSFRIRPGEKVGIIGRIGSGKTTIGRLLAGLYYASEGEILIDGVDIRQYHPHEVRRQIGLLVQDGDLFRGSVKDNIQMADPLADDEAILKATRLAGVDAFVSQHPMGYDMPVGERGSLLSGGQRQAIALGRLLLVNPQILFLDEPSSSMDLASERELIRHLRLVVGDNRTVVISTHRYSLLSLVDRLIVLDQGRIAADGPKDKVLEALQRKAKAAGPETV